MRFFNAQARDQIESVAAEGRANKAKRLIEDQALKAKRSDTDSDQALKVSDSVSDQISQDQPESESRSPRLV